MATRAIIFVVVSIHAPAGGATTIFLPASWRCYVSIHAPAGGATWFYYVIIPYRVRFQSTHPRGVRRCEGQHCRVATEVSIHAPAGGATGVSCQHFFTNNVSIHAPAGGATCRICLGFRFLQRFNPRPRGGCDIKISLCKVFCVCFNPRTRGGCDKSIRSDCAIGIIVSIHAPAGGATVASLLSSAQ